MPESQISIFVDLVCRLARNNNLISDCDVRDAVQGKVCNE